MPVPLQQIVGESIYVALFQGFTCASESCQSYVHNLHLYIENSTHREQGSQVEIVEYTDLLGDHTLPQGNQLQPAGS